MKKILGMSPLEIMITVIIIVILVGILIPARSEPPWSYERRRIAESGRHIVRQLLAFQADHPTEKSTLEGARAAAYLNATDLEFYVTSQGTFTPFDSHTPSNTVILDIPVVYRGEIKSRVIFELTGRARYEPPETNQNNKASNQAFEAIGDPGSPQPQR